jgi:hypothetical protein
VPTNRTSTSVPPVTPAEGDNTPAEDDTAPTATADSKGPDQTTEPEHPLPPPTGRLPVQSSTPVPQDQGETSLIEKAQIGLVRADKVGKSIEGSDTWEGVVGRVKWLMDTLSPVAGVRVIFVLPSLD